MWEVDYKILSELIAQSAQIQPIELPYKNQEVILTEEDQDIQYAIKIKGLPPATFIIKSDIDGIGVS